MVSNMIVRNYKKLTLIALGLLLLFLASQTIISVYIVITITFLTFFLSDQKCRINDIHKIKKIERYTVPFAFLILVLFNIFGLVKTLTGTIENKDSISLLFVGVTFYALSAGAYICDIKNRYTRDNYVDEFIDLFLYLILPFKLLAGPLENPQMIKQFNDISFGFKSTARFLYSFSWISLGLFMKFCIASRLTPSELLSFTDPLGSFICAFIFELKFYFDFAGYSFIAFGLAKLINLKLTLNFNHPFTARNVVEFWHKWHITLGKFLQKYILYKNLYLFNSRISKAIFASTIFIISAMWHGGTINYFFWGLFHGLVYLFYIQKFKHLKIPRFLGYLSMFLFFVFGRMIAIDINSGRLIEKWVNYFNINSYSEFSLVNLNELLSLGLSTGSTLYICMIFIFAEFWQVKFYNRTSYHLFRKPIASVFLFLITILFGFNSMELLYARI